MQVKKEFYESPEPPTWMGLIGKLKHGFMVSWTTGITAGCPFLPFTICCKDIRKRWRLADINPTYFPHRDWSPEEALIDEGDHFEHGEDVRSTLKRKCLQHPGRKIMSNIYVRITTPYLTITHIIWVRSITLILRHRETWGFRWGDLMGCYDLPAQIRAKRKDEQGEVSLVGLL